MTPISLRLTTPRVSGFDRLAKTSTRDAREPAKAGAQPSGPTKADVRAAVDKLGTTMREAVAAVSRSTSLPRPEPEVVVGRAIATGQAQSLGAGVSEKLKYNPTFDDIHVGMVGINGQSLQVNTSRDNLAGVVASLNAFSGLSASLDSHSGLVTIVADRPGETLQISDAAGFFDALGIQMGTVRPAVAVRPRGSNPRSVAAAAAVGEAVAGINGVLETLARARGVPAGLDSEVLTAVRDTVAAATGSSAAGIALTSVNGRDKLTVDPAALTTVLANDPHAVDQLLSGPRGLPEVVKTVLDRHDGGVAAAPPSALPPLTKMLDGRRLLGTRPVIRDVGVQLQVMRRFASTPTVANRVDVLA